MFRATRLAQLQDEAKALSEDVGLTVQRRTARADQLRRHLAACEAQHAVAVRSHLSAVDALLALHGERAASLLSAFDQRVHAAQSFLHAQRAAAQAAHGERMQALNADLAAIRTRAVQEAEQDASAFSAECQALEDAAQEEAAVLRMCSEVSMGVVSAQLDACVRRHSEATAEMVAAVEELTQREAASSRALTARTRELARLTNALHALLCEQEEGSQTLGAQAQQLKADKETLLQLHTELKRTMERSRAQDAGRLRALALACAARAKALGEVLAKANKVARLAELNAKADAQQRAQLAALGVLEQPGATLSALEHRERARLRAMLTTPGDLHDAAWPPTGPLQSARPPTAAQLALMSKGALLSGAVRARMQTR